ncbi:MAG: N-6 DNA methylase, partial [Selenomonadaceae bacterium]|nr:N-6 DNA methylase [Selenomonadaceae bacterium]
VSFQFKDGADTHETFQDRLQKLYADGMKKFMGEDIFYLPENYPDKLFANFRDEENHDEQIRDLRENFRKLKFYTNNAFAFVEVQNDKLFYLNAKILKEVAEILKDYRIIGSTDLQTLGDLFEQLLSKGFKQDAGQFFTPTPIAQFIWDSLPLDRIISQEPPKIIDYACGAGHFLTEGFRAVNDFYARRNLTPPTMWERDKLFGVEKDYRLARVSKISLFMHGANEGKIKFGDGLENYPDENISPASFDILVANPPYSVKGFKAHLKLKNPLEVLDKISNDGSEIETLFAERLGQLVKPRGVAAVILPSSILNKDGKSFIAARESLLKSFYIRAIVQLGSKTFGATGTNTVIMFLERFDEPPRMTADYEDVAATILEKKPLGRQFSRDIFDGYLKKTGKTAADLSEIDREKIIYFGLTFKQTTLIISAPDDVKEQEKFLGYGWSNAKGREGIVHKKRGGLLFDNTNRATENTLAAVIRKIFSGEQLQIPALEKYFHYATLADLLDFDSDKFNKTITLASPDYAPAEYSGNFELVKLGEVAPFVTERTTLDEIQLADFVTTDNMLKDKRGIKIYDGEPQISALTKFLAGDVLISNIRPYLKKIWLADRAGGCSPDVLVFRSRDENILLTEYLFEVLRQDDFFAFAMSTAKGMKMPRGDKDKIKTYKLPLPPVEVQSKIVEEFKAIDAQLAAAVDTIQNLDADVQDKFAELFEDYSGAKNHSFTSLCKDDTASGVKFQTSEYLKTGEFPIIDQSVNEIAGYMNPENNSPPYDDLPCIIFGDHTEIFKLERERFYLGADGTKIIIPIDRNKLDATFLFYMLSEEYKPLGGYARHFKNLKSLKLYMPPLELQKEFAEYVRDCEAKKEKARARRDELIREREELVQKYFR